MDRLLESLVVAQRRLTDAGIDSVAIGGVAVAAWGEVRVTRDVDLRVLLERDDSALLLQALGQDYAPLGIDLSPADALSSLGMLFVRDALGTRLDLLLSDVEFDREAVRRGVLVAFGPLTIRVCTAEDLLVYKILGARPKDLADVPGIVLRQGTNLDVDYIVNWLRRFEQMIDDSTLVDTFRRYLT